MDEKLYQAKDFTGFVQKHYTRFFQIDKVMESPPVVNKNDLTEPNWMEIVLPDFDPQSLSESCELEESGSIVRLEPKTSTPFPYQGKELDLFKRGAELGLGEDTITSIQEMLERMANKWENQNKKT